MNQFKTLIIVMLIFVFFIILFFMQKPSSILENFDGSSNNVQISALVVNIPTKFYTNDGKTATFSNNTLVVITPQGDTTNYISTNTSSNITDHVFYDTNGGYAKIFTDGTHYFVEVQPYNGTLFVLTSNPPPPTESTSSSPFSSSSSSSNAGLGSGGIPFSMIPPGNEDLYIKKSEIVPPVCPKCPDITMNSSSSGSPEKCPPCPACARCPEPNFECKKVPNYNTMDANLLPMPILNDFSTFGM